MPVNNNERSLCAGFACTWTRRPRPTSQVHILKSQPALNLISVNRQARALTSVSTAQCRRRISPLSNLLRKKRQALFSANSRSSSRSVLSFPYSHARTNLGGPPPTGSRWSSSSRFLLTLRWRRWYTWRLHQSVKSKGCRRLHQFQRCQLSDIWDTHTHINTCILLHADELALERVVCSFLTLEIDTL